MLVPVIVVVPSVLEATSPSFPVTPAAPDSPGSVAYTVAVEVCLMVVVTTVVDDPDPRVYVRTTDSPDDPLPPVGAAVTPVPRGTVAAGVETAPPAVVDARAVAVYEARAAELADSASATGHTVVVRAMVSVTTISLVDPE